MYRRGYPLLWHRHILFKKRFHVMLYCMKLFVNANEEKEMKNNNFFEFYTF